MTGLKYIILILFLLLLASFARAENKVYVYLFYGEGCPHCAAERSLLEQLQQKYPEVEIRSFEIYGCTENSNMYTEMCKAYGTRPYGVPTTFIGDEYVIGYINDDITGKEIEEKIKHCVQFGCVNPEEKLKTYEEGGKECVQSEIVTLPLFGDIDVSKMGLLAFSAMIGLLDGFNACAMWVLCFLLSLLIYSGSRKRVFLIGGIFIFISGLVYFFFMAAWMNLFLFVGYLPVARLIIGGMGIIFGIINIKDFFLFGKGVSLVISKSAKPGIFRKIRKLVKPAAMPATLFGVATLAVGVNVVELLCTAGFPMIFTGVLTAHKLSVLTYYFYMFVYILFYMLDDLAIFTVVVITMSSKRFTEKYGKISKLISGIIILILGILLVFKPKLLMFG